MRNYELCYYMYNMYMSLNMYLNAQNQELLVKIYVSTGLQNLKKQSASYHLIIFNSNCIIFKFVDFQIY